jgi:hypothetical protein
MEIGRTTEVDWAYACENVEFICYNRTWQCIRKVIDSNVGRRALPFATIIYFIIK